MADRPELDALLAAAEKATPGPWHSYEGDLMTGPLEHGYGPKLGSFNFKRVRHGGETDGWDSQSAADAHFTALCSPETIRWLVERVRELEGGCVSLKAQMDALADSEWGKGYDQAREEFEDR